jgi:hypothetical protein
MGDQDSKPEGQKAARGTHVKQIDWIWRNTVKPGKEDDRISIYLVKAWSVYDIERLDDLTDFWVILRFITFFRTKTLRLN